MNATPKIKAIAPWFKDASAMQYALFLLASGVLSLDRKGRFWRHATITRRGTLWLPKPRRAENVGGKGYLRLTLYIPHVGLRSVMAHRVVWTKLRGEIPDGLQVNHEDLNKTNNAISNLELVDGSGNIRHSYANGRTRPWSHSTEWRPGKPRRTQEDIERVTALRGEGRSIATISEATGISKTHVARLLKKGGA